MISSIRFAGSIALLLVASQLRADDRSLQLRVMSFNIRYGTAKDGENHWDRRKEFLMETIKSFDPDVLGTQETLGFQRDYLAEQLAGYESLGVGRVDGKEDGEMMAVYFKKDRFERLDGGHFWLSEMPDKPGSVSWDSSLPRMVTWLRLRDRKQPSAQPIAFFNTHFDHRGPQARQQSARLLRQKVNEIGKECSLIVTGDFNAGEGSPPYRALLESVDQQDSPLVDTYRAAHAQRTDNEGTFSGFSAAAKGGSRIDWIAVSRDWQIVEAAIDRTSRDGKTPSDHFAVTAVITRAP